MVCGVTPEGVTTRAREHQTVSGQLWKANPTHNSGRCRTQAQRVCGDGVVRLQR